MAANVVEQSTIAPDSAAPPEDFNAYESWKNGTPPADDAPETPEPAKPASETAAESETAKQEPDELDPKDLSHKGLQKRFAKLTTKIRDLEGRLAAAPAKATPEPAKPESAATPGKPVASAFDTYEAYVESLTDWKLEQREIARTKEETERRAAEKQRSVADAWQTRLTEARTRHADFDDVIAEAEDQPISAAMNQAILESENGPDVVYFLATNPEEAARIAKLEPIAAARAIGRIEASLDKPDPKPQPKVTGAPKPPNPVGAKAAPASKSIFDEAVISNYEQWEGLRNAQLKR